MRAYAKQAEQAKPMPKNGMSDSSSHRFRATSLFVYASHRFEKYFKAATRWNWWNVWCRRGKYSNSILWPSTREQRIVDVSSTTHNGIHAHEHVTYDVRVKPFVTIANRQKSSKNLLRKHSHDIERFAKCIRFENVPTDIRAIFARELWGNTFFRTIIYDRHQFWCIKTEWFMIVPFQAIVCIEKAISSSIPTFCKKQMKPTRSWERIRNGMKWVSV